MSALHIHLESDIELSDQNKASILDVVESGGLLIFPTDTIYGLGCKADAVGSALKIAKLKQRDPNQPYSLHVGSVDEIEEFAVVESSIQRTYIKALLPGPYTLILHGKPNAPKPCLSADGKIGIRVPDSIPFRQLYSFANTPLIGTSVNISGKQPLLDINEIVKQYSKRVDLILSIDQMIASESSNVIDITFVPPLVIRGTLPDTIGL